jgi:iron complex transport system ATP-binding protein
LIPVVEAEELFCGYGERPVLKGITLSVKPGERVALLGPNGSGKSTLFRVFGGLMRATSGQVRLGGNPIEKLPPREVARRVATVPQEEAPRFAFTVRQIVTMGRLALSDGLFDTSQDAEEAARAMEIADCLHLQDRAVGELSGGERQRVLIARALAQRAPLVLLDEPTSHLDPAHQLAVANLIRALADQGVATITAVHDLNFAGRVSERAILLEDGRVGIDDSVGTVLRSSVLDRVYRVAFSRIYLAFACTGAEVMVPLPGDCGVDGAS